MRKGSEEGNGRERSVRGTGTHRDVGTATKSQREASREGRREEGKSAVARPEDGLRTAVKKYTVSILGAMGSH